MQVALRGGEFAHLWIVHHILFDTEPDSAILACSQIHQLATTVAKNMVESSAFHLRIVNYAYICLVGDRCNPFATF